MPVESPEQALPGFELMVVTKAEQDLADIGADIRHKEFTGEMLRLRYPGKYALAARAFFEKNRSAESICDILQISPQTMHALVETECAARGFSTVKARIRAKAASVALRTVSELQKLLDDPDAVRKAGIVGLTNALKALTGKEDGSSEGEKPESESREDKEADEIIDVYEQAADGFWREKNPARESNESTGVDARRADPATMTGDAGKSAVESVIQSASNAKIQGNTRDVAKIADKSARNQAQEPTADTPQPPQTLPSPPGGDPHTHVVGPEEVKLIHGTGERNGEEVH